jgi:excisionase family DNA binding protein
MFQTDKYDNRERGFQIPTGLMRVREFRAVLGADVGEKTLRKHIKEGKLRAVRMGRRVLVLASELEDYPKRLAAEQARQ